MKTPKLKKPSLKRPPGGGSSIKPPKLVSDLYADLRDRRLLPLMALLAVAIVAAPFLLSNDDSPEPPPVPAPAAPPATAASFEVVPAQPELRDYRKRLEHRKRVSPFSTYAAARVSNQTREEVEGVLNTVEGGGGTETATTETAVPTGATEAPTTEYAPAQPPVVKATVKANVGYAAVLEVGFVGSDPHERTVEDQTKLPSEKNPAIVYTGISPDKSGGLFLMTNNVTAFYGKGQCVLGGATCQQLKLKVGKSATFAIGFGETRYKVTLVGFVPIVKEAKIERGG